jgi:hypothetical protein
MELKVVLKRNVLSKKLNYLKFIRFYLGEMFMKATQFIIRSISRILLSLLIFTILGCENPKDIIFGADPIKQISEQSSIFKKLPEEDRTLLVQYLLSNEMGKIFNAQYVNPTTGKTVSEVLIEANKWKEHLKEIELEKQKREEEATLLKTKVLEERKAIADKISSSVVIAVIDKNVLYKNYRIDRFNDLLEITYAIENKSTKLIKQIKGNVIFKDATGDDIGTLSVDINEPIKSGQTLKTSTDRGWKINPFMTGDVEQIASREFNTMTASFIPESIAFEGGEIIKAPELP